MKGEYKEITFTDADVVNKDDFIPKGEYNPYNKRPFLLHDHGFTICIVFADTLQDALDEAVDNDKLDAFQIDPKDPNDREDYMTQDVNEMAMGFDANCPEFIDDQGGKWWWKVEPTYLGNASEPFDIEGLDAIELPNPPFSFVALFNAHQEKQ